MPVRFISKRDNNHFCKGTNSFGSDNNSNKKYGRNHEDFYDSFRDKRIITIILIIKTVR